MSDDKQTMADDSAPRRPDDYVPPSIELLGSVEDLTRGPDLGAGDIPVGVISF